MNGTELRSGALDATAIETDWTHEFSWDEWRVLVPDPPQCPNCEDERCEDYEEGSARCPECGEWVEYDNEGPMVNYRYPVGGLTVSQAQAAVDDGALAGLPLCLVEYDGEPFLALTGGGMDLSWEICQAYVNLGYLPPVAFCSDLPNMGDARVRPEVVRAGAQALSIARDRAAWRFDRFMEQWGAWSGPEPEGRP